MSAEELTMQDQAIAAALLDGRTLADISKTYGVSTKLVYRRQKDPVFVGYMETLKLRRIREQGDWEGTATELNDVFSAITAPSVMARIMQLALLEPNETKGNIQGQIQALTFIWEKMGFQGPAPKAAAAKAAVNIYASAWRTETTQ